MELSRVDPRSGVSRWFTEEEQMRGLLTSAAVSLALLTAPLAHAAAPARASAPMTAESQLDGEFPLSVLIVLATVLGGAIVLLVDDDGDDDPDSP